MCSAGFKMRAMVNGHTRWVVYDCSLLEGHHGIHLLSQDPRILPED